MKPISTDAITATQKADKAAGGKLSPFEKNPGN